jgi:hypothetical protein
MARKSKVFKQQYYPKTGLREIFIKGDIGELVIEPHDEDFIDISGMVIGGDASDVLVDQEEIDNIFRIGIYSKDEKKVFNVKVKIRIPLSIRLTLLSVNTDMGDIRIDGLPVKKMALYSSNGDIIVGGVAGEEVKIESINGDLYVRGGSIKRLNATSTNGDIRVEIQEAGSNIKINNINGMIRLLITKDTDVKVRASTINGIIKTYNKEYFIDLDYQNRYLMGILGKGNNEVILDNVNGNIRIDILETPTIE